MKGVDPPQTSFAGEIICDTVFWNIVPNTTDWHTPMIKKTNFVMIRLKQVLITDLVMNKIDETNTLPSTCNKRSNNFKCNEDR